MYNSALIFALLTKVLTVSTSSKNVYLNCLDLGPLSKLLDSVFKVDSSGPEPLNVTFFLVTRNWSQRLVIDGQTNSDFDIRRRTVVIIHGFMSNAFEAWVENMQNAFLHWGDVNVISVDWSEGSNTWNYLKAAVNTRTVGDRLISLLSNLAMKASYYQVPNSNNWGSLYLVGHSLGAHISGYTAKMIRKIQMPWIVSRITGLDPARPCFENTDRFLQLDKSDALFVDVIHTNGRRLISFGLGMFDPLGHVDFYPNGGKIQPGCMNTTSCKLLPVSISAIQCMVCNHGRSYEYFTSSLLAAAYDSNCVFFGLRWSLPIVRRNALNVDPNEVGEACTEMGINAENYPCRGIFFVETTDKNPYCLRGNFTYGRNRVASRDGTFDDVFLIKWKLENFLELIHHYYDIVSLDEKKWLAQPQPDPRLIG